jgi:hypothetical protein
LRQRKCDDKSVIANRKSRITKGLTHLGRVPELLMAGSPLRDRGKSFAFAQRVVQVHIGQPYHPHRRRLSASHDFAGNALQDLSEGVALHAFTMLGYAAEHEPHAVALAYKAIHADPARMIMPAVTAAAETGLPIDALLAGEIRFAAMNLFQLARVSAAIPLKSKSLDRTAVVVRKYFIEASANELSDLERRTADHEEIQRRQVELMELARILRYRHEQERALPASIREQLLAALHVQHDALAINGRPAEVESLSKEIAWIDSHPPP